MFSLIRYTAFGTASKRRPLSFSEPVSLALRRADCNVRCAVPLPLPSTVALLAARKPGFSFRFGRAIPLFIVVPRRKFRKLEIV